MKASMETACALLKFLDEERTDLEPAWNSFLTEASEKMDLIKGVKWDPTNEVDKEIHDMQVG
jgi:hypothetical protein